MIRRGRIPGRASYLRRDRRHEDRHVEPGQLPPGASRGVHDHAEGAGLLQPPLGQRPRLVRGPVRGGRRRHRPGRGLDQLHQGAVAPPRPRAHGGRAARREADLHGPQPGQPHPVALHPQRGQQGRAAPDRGGRPGQPRLPRLQPLRVPDRAVPRALPPVVAAGAVVRAAAAGAPGRAQGRLPVHRRRPRRRGPQPPPGVQPRRRQAPHPGRDRVPAALGQPHRDRPAVPGVVARLVVEAQPGRAHPGERRRPPGRLDLGPSWPTTWPGCGTWSAPTSRCGTRRSVRGTGGRREDRAPVGGTPRRTGGGCAGPAPPAAPAARPGRAARARGGPASRRRPG